MRDGGNGLADLIGIAFFACLSDHDLVPVMASVSKPVLPTFAAFHFVPDLGPQGLVLKSSKQLLATVTKMTRMDECRDAQSIVYVGIDVRSDLVTSRPGCFDAGDCQLHLSPVLPTGGL